MRSRRFKAMIRLATRGAFGRAGVAAAISLAMLGCSDTIDLDNGRPRVTWVAIEAIDADQAALTLWVQDVEGDAVDIDARWTSGGESGPVVLRPGSAPLSGLPTQLNLLKTLYHLLKYLKYVSKLNQLKMSAVML